MCIRDSGHGSDPLPHRAGDIVGVGHAHVVVVVAVSYTHLDVYKRQAGQRPSDAPGGAGHQRDLFHGIILLSQSFPVSIANVRGKGKMCIRDSEEVRGVSFGEQMRRRREELGLTRQA